MQVVVQRLAFAQEFRREDDLVAAQLFTDAARITDGNGRLDNDGRRGIDRRDRADHRLDRPRVETVGRGVVIGRGGDDDIVGAGKRFVGVQRRLEVQLFLGQETLDFRVDDRRLAVVEHLDLGRHDIVGHDRIVARQQHGIGQADITQAGNGNFHNQSHPEKYKLTECVVHSTKRAARNGGRSAIDRCRRFSGSRPGKFSRPNVRRPGAAPKQLR